MAVSYSKSFKSVNRKTFNAPYSGSCRVPIVFRGDRLAELLNAQGMSQSQLARLVGVSQATIWKLVKEPSQGSKHTHRIARELGTSPEFLMGRLMIRHPTGSSASPAISIVVPEPDPDQVEIDMIDLAFGMGATFADQAYIEAEKVGFSRKWLRQFTHAAPSQLFTTKGIGDSMMPTISDHDIVVVDRTDQRPQFGDKIWASSLAAWP
jgi:transcriptional regulator with XRE-family HTH domain